MVFETMISRFPFAVQWHAGFLYAGVVTFVNHRYGFYIVTFTEYHLVIVSRMAHIILVINGAKTFAWFPFDFPDCPHTGLFHVFRVVESHYLLELMGLLSY